MDLWWPTFARYTGWMIGVYEVVVDHFQHPEALVLAGGMMGLKEVLETREKRRDS